MSQTAQTMNANSFSLRGKTALVTGGASGIGAATVRSLAVAGAMVFIADINLSAAEAFAAELTSAYEGLSVHSLGMDVTSSRSIQANLDHLRVLDILVNNAGIGLVGDIEHTEEDDFDRIMAVNVRSVYLVTRALLPLLLSSHGSIVNIGSVAGLVGIRQRFAYCASKGAVIAMTRQLAVEYPRTLRVNCIAPGTVQTPFVEGYLEKYHKHEKEKIREELVARQPIGRLGTPDDVASMVRYLCSDEASFITGSIMTLDGGWTAA
jgi:2-keto-3-deoxy-L-fuconate dehydrogenase